jgi:hypothetical protein
MSRRVSTALSTSWSILLVAVVGCGGTDIPTAAVTGTITVNGKPVEGVTVSFVPDAKIRPSVGITDAKGRYKAQFVRSQSGVALGPCVAQFSIYRGESLRNYLPAEFNEKAADNPELHLNVTEEGVVFDYDIKCDGEIPPYEPGP